MDQGKMHVEMRSNHVRLPLIDGGRPAAAQARRNAALITKRGYSGRKGELQAATRARRQAAVKGRRAASRCWAS